MSTADFRTSEVDSKHRSSRNDVKSSRHFVNQYPDYDSQLDPDQTLARQSLHEKIDPKLRTELVEIFHKLLAIEEEHLPEVIRASPDCSVYTGSGGIALMYLHILRIEEFERERPEYLSRAQKLISALELEPSMAGKKRDTFLCGDAGLAALSAYYCHLTDKMAKRDKYLQKLLSRINHVEEPSLADEMLYGRSGYLFALLFVLKNMPDQTVITNHHVHQVVSAIIRSGLKTAEKERNSHTPLMYYWHDKGYIGAAHGLAGIFYALLEAKDYIDEDNLNLIRLGVDYVLTLQMPSGNFPSSLTNTDDKLVHWCHGAPGVLYLMCKAYKTFGDKKYLTAAEKASDVIWERGLLRKGFGLCHGIAGNGYAFLYLYQTTGDVKQLYRAIKFARFCGHYGKGGMNTPDRPFSLYEGLAGAVCFVADMIEPTFARFPAFQLNAP